MASKLILQGLSEANHLEAVEQLLAMPNLSLAIISVAFIKTSGVFHLTPALAPIAGRVKVYAGIRNGITSAQALKDLLDLGVEVYVVDTGSISLVYHPKLYYARGNGEARVLVGSANLTAGGMNDNIEASLVVDLDPALAPQRALCTSIEKAFNEMPTEYPKNVKKLAATLTLDELLLDARLVDETVAPKPVGVSSSNGDPHATPRMHTKSRRLPASPKRKASVRKMRALAVAAAAVPGTAPQAGKAIRYVRVWSTDGLTERDLNIPRGSNTNATGSMNLDKGDLLGDYEWADYFRLKVFQGLAWSAPDARKIERASGKFRLIVEGIDCGELTLDVRHDTKTNTASYRQRNSMTNLSWGVAKPFVARRELIGRTLTLSKAVGHPDRFLVEID